ncbi:MAG: hypothetical protein WBE13_09690 [Candidatus Acidiferrum sp.]
MTDEERRFRCLVLDILTGIALIPAAMILFVVFIVLILSLLMRYDRPTPRPVQDEDVAFGRLDGLEVTQTCPHNSWYEYVIDFKTLGVVTTHYVSYIRRKPDMDMNDYLLPNLRSSLEDLRKRNEIGARTFDHTNFHSDVLPREFGLILDAIESKKRVGLSVSDERALQRAIQNWYTEAGFPPANAISSTISGWCAFN